MNNFSDEAFNLIQKRKFKEALRIFDEIIQKSPDDGASYEGAARCFLGLKKYDKALEFAKRAVELRPKDFMAHATLSYAYLNNNNLGKSYEAARLAYELNPESSYVLECLGTVLVYKKNFDEALELLTKAVQIYPSSIIGHHNLAYIYEKFGRQSEAISHRKAVFTTRPTIRHGFAVLLSYLRLHPYITSWTIWIVTAIAYVDKLRFLLIIPLVFVGILFWRLLSAFVERKWRDMGLVLFLIFMFGFPVIYILFFAR